MAPAANDARYSERNKKVSDGREKYLGSFVWCIKNTHLLTSINKNSFGGCFLLSANARLIRKTAAADSDGWLCYLFGMQGTVNMLNGANLNIFLSWPFSLNHSGTLFAGIETEQVDVCCRKFTGQLEIYSTFSFLLSPCFAMWCRWLTHWRRRCKMRNSSKNWRNMRRLGIIQTFLIFQLQVNSWWASKIDKRQAEWWVIPWTRTKFGDSMIGWQQRKDTFMIITNKITKLWYWLHLRW